MAPWLIEVTAPSEPPTIIGLDFAFGYPKGAGESAFESSSWRGVLQRIRELSGQLGTAREVAKCLNDQFYARFQCPGPFFSYSAPPSAAPYQKGGFGYYRLTEHFVPQAKSPWYVGSGAQVGLSTLTGLAMLADLLNRRGGDRSVIIWPHEVGLMSQARHVIVEAYPVLMGARKANDRHAEDAGAIAQWLKKQDEDGELAVSLDLPRVAQRWNQDEEVFAERVGWEGWIIGV